MMSLVIYLTILTLILSVTHLKKIANEKNGLGIDISLWSCLIPLMIELAALSTDNPGILRNNFKKDQITR